MLYIYIVNFFIVKVLVNKKGLPVRVILFAFIMSLF